MTHQVAHAEIVDSRLRGIYLLAGAAALLAGTILFISAISLMTSVLQPGSVNGLFLPLQNNWLIVILKVHAGFGGSPIDLLHGVDALDIAILALVGVTYLGLYAALRSTSKIWSIIAAIQPFLGIVLFVTTQKVGRSGIMGAALVISFVMLRSHIFNKSTAYIGILASVLLLIGDFSASAIPPLTTVAALFGVGYLLFVVWFFIIGGRIFQLGSSLFKRSV